MRIQQEEADRMRIQQEEADRMRIQQEERIEHEQQFDHLHSSFCTYNFDSMVLLHEMMNAKATSSLSALSAFSRGLRDADLLAIGVFRLFALEAECRRHLEGTMYTSMMELISKFHSHAVGLAATITVNDTTAPKTGCRPLVRSVSSSSPYRHQSTSAASSPSSPAASAAVIVSGWLWQAIGAGSSWRKRFFVLHEGVLRMQQQQASPSSSSPPSSPQQTTTSSTVVVLRTSCLRRAALTSGTCSISKPPVDKYTQASCGLYVETEQRYRHYFCAPTKAECKMWLEAFKREIAP
eukprot:PhM_4_TR8993/c0_g1_i1/m.3520